MRWAFENPVADEKAPDDVQAFGFADHVALVAFVDRYRELAGGPVCAAPVQEPVDVVSGAGTAAELGVDVMLGAVAEPAAAGPEPIEEFGGHGRGLLRSQERPGLDGPGSGLVA